MGSNDRLWRAIGISVADVATASGEVIVSTSLLLSRPVDEPIAVQGIGGTFDVGQTLSGAGFDGYKIIAVSDGQGEAMP